MAAEKRTCWGSYAASRSLTAESLTGLAGNPADACSWLQRGTWAVQTGQSCSSALSPTGSKHASSAKKSAQGGLNSHVTLFSLNLLQLLAETKQIKPNCVPSITKANIQYTGTASWIFLAVCQFGGNYTS